MAKEIKDLLFIICWVCMVCAYDFFVIDGKKFYGCLVVVSTLVIIILCCLGIDGVKILHVKYTVYTRKQRNHLKKQLYKAARKDDVDTLNRILRSNPSLIDEEALSHRSNGATLMHVATMFEKPRIVEQLIELGSRAFNIPDSVGRLPIHYAADDDRLPILRLLANADKRTIDARDISGHTPLGIAAMNSNNKAIETLWLMGSQAIDVPNNSGTTPLGFAASSNGSSTIELLVRLGSKTIETPCIKGDTPFSRSLYGGYPASSTLIISALCGYFITSKERNFVRTYMRSTHDVLNHSHDWKLFVLETRYRVYFSQSLTSRLLAENERCSNLNS